MCPHELVGNPNNTVGVGELALWWIVARKLPTCACGKPVKVFKSENAFYFILQTYISTVTSLIVSVTVVFTEALNY